MFGLLLDMIASLSTDKKRVVNHAEIGRHGGGIRIVDAIATHLEDGILGVIVNPHTLHQAFGLTTLIPFGSGLSPRAGQQHQHDSI